MKGIMRSCPNFLDPICKKTFYVRNSRVISGKGGKYCSPHCWRVVEGIRMPVCLYCTYCGAKVFRPAWKKPSKNVFCKKACLAAYRREFPNLGTTPLLQSRHSFIGLRKRWARSRIFTPALLRRMMDWKGETCSYPDCDKPLSKRRKNRWNACELHAHRVRSALHSAQKDRKAVLQSFGLESI